MINPCGMGMDVLRSCYRTEMIFQEGGTPIRVRWFFCEPGAEVFPGRHLFSSLNYEWPYIWGENPGEVRGANRPWRNGSVPPFDGSTGDGFDGKKFAGPLLAFQEGASPSDPPIGGNPRGLCAGCAPIPPVNTCVGEVLPPTVYFRVLSVSYVQSGTLPSTFVPAYVPTNWGIPLAYNSGNDDWELTSVLFTGLGENWPNIFRCEAGPWVISTYVDSFETPIVADSQNQPGYIAYWKSLLVAFFDEPNPTFEYWECAILLPET
jgi:hypothetical protein